MRRLFGGRRGRVGALQPGLCCVVEGQALRTPWLGDVDVRYERVEGR